MEASVGAPLLLADEVPVADVDVVAVAEGSPLALDEEEPDEEPDEVAVEAAVPVGVPLALSAPVPLAEPLLLEVPLAEPVPIEDNVAVMEGSQLALADAEGVAVADAEALGVHPTPLKMPTTSTVEPSSAMRRLRGAACGAGRTPAPCTANLRCAACGAGRTPAVVSRTRRRGRGLRAAISRAREPLAVEAAR